MNFGNTRAVDKWQGYVPGNYEFYWSQLWEPHLGPGRKLHSGGPFGTKHWWLMNGEPALCLCVSLNNVLYASFIRASQLNINFGIAPKREGFGIGLPHHA